MAETFRRTKLIRHMKRMVEGVKSYESELEKSAPNSPMYFIHNGGKDELNNAISMLKYEFGITDAEIGRE